MKAKVNRLMVACVLLAGSLGAAAAEGTACFLRVGVLGDVHIDQRHFGEPGGGHSVEVFRTALRSSRDRTRTRVFEFLLNHAESQSRSLTL